MTKFKNKISASTFICNDFDNQSGQMTIDDIIYVDDDLSASFTLFTVVNVYADLAEGKWPVNNVNIYGF